MSVGGPGRALAAVALFVPCSPPPPPLAYGANLGRRAARTLPAGCPVLTRLARPSTFRPPCPPRVHIKRTQSLGAGHPRFSKWYHLTTAGGADNPGQRPAGFLLQGRPARSPAGRAAGRGPSAYPLTCSLCALRTWRRGSGREGRLGVATRRSLYRPGRALAVNLAAWAMSRSRRAPTMSTGMIDRGAFLSAVTGMSHHETPRPSSTPAWRPPQVILGAGELGHAGRTCRCFVAWPCVPGGLHQDLEPDKGSRRRPGRSRCLLVLRGRPFAVGHVAGPGVSAVKAGRRWCHSQDAVRYPARPGRELAWPEVADPSP